MPFRGGWCPAAGLSGRINRFQVTGGVLGFLPRSLGVRLFSFAANEVSTVNMQRPTLFAALGVAVFLMVGCTEPNAYQPPPPPTVSVARPVQQTVTLYLEETGKTEAVRYAEVRARVKGFLETIEFAAGDDVKQGQVLYTIDPEPFIAVQAQQRAALKLAQRELRLADSLLETSKTLRRSGAETEETYNEKAADRDVKASKIAAAEATLREADLDLSYTQVARRRSSSVRSTP